MVDDNFMREASALCLLANLGKRCHDGCEFAFSGNFSLTSMI